MKTIILISFCIALASANTYGGYGGHTETKILKPVIPIVRFLSNSDNYGTYSHETEGGDGTKLAESGSLKNINNQVGSIKSGSYEWTSPEGQHFQVSYTADENGFHPVAAHLPTPPPIPEDIQKMLPLLPKLKEEHNSYDSYGTRVESYSAPAVSYGGYTHHTSFGSAVPAPMSSSFVAPPAPLPSTMETTFPFLVGPPVIPSPNIDTPDFSIHTSDPSRTFVRIGH